LLLAIAVAPAIWVFTIRETVAILVDAVVAPPVGSLAQVGVLAAKVAAVRRTV
jgi:hypothetical protein